MSERGTRCVTNPSFALRADRWLIALVMKGTPGSGTAGGTRIDPDRRSRTEGACPTRFGVGGIIHRTLDRKAVDPICQTGIGRSPQTPRGVGPEHRRGVFSVRRAGLPRTR